MAVVQISKIQIRRDIKDASADSDLPIKLSDGEFAWCRDTRQLYIGSAIVGAPGQLENVELLTEYSDIFSLGRYTYKNNGVYRSFTKRLEDRVSANDFGIREGNLVDYANSNNNALNGIINKLFRDTSNDSKSVLEFGPGIYLFSETILIPSYTHIRGSGKGNTYIKFLGSGSAFQFIHDDTTTTIGLDNQCKFVKFSDMTIEIVRPDTVDASFANNDSVIFDLYGTKHCEFTNLELRGPLLTGSIQDDVIISKAFNFDKSRFIYTQSLANVVVTGTSGQFTCGISQLAVGTKVMVSGINTGTGVLQGYSNPKEYIISATNGTTTFTLVNPNGTPITTVIGSTTGLTFKIGAQQILLGPLTYSNTNLIDNVSIKNFQFGIYTEGYINKNTISNCFIYDVKMGISFGKFSDTDGPKHNIIKSCMFDQIQKHAVKIYKGYGNICVNNQYLNVGNNFGGIQNSAFGQVEFDVPGNLNQDYNSNRHKELSFYGPNSYSTRPYVAEFTGYGLNNNNLTQVKDIVYSANPVDFIRFPLQPSTTPGIGPESMYIEVEYIYQSKTFDSVLNDETIFKKSRRVRKGTMTLIVDYRANSFNAPVINFYDDYEYVGYGQTLGATGNITNEDEFLIFEAKEQINSIQNQKQVVITYRHNSAVIGTSEDNVPFEQGKLTYTYRVLT